MRDDCGYCEFYTNGECDCLVKGRYIPKKKQCFCCEDEWLYTCAVCGNKCCASHCREMRRGVDLCAFHWCMEKSEWETKL